MNGIKRKIYGDEKGSATVEFAIGLPMIFIVMVFVFEFSSLFWAHHIATNNVRSAVRYLSRAPLPLVEPYLTQVTNIAVTGDPASAIGAYDWMADIATPDIDTSYSDFSEDDFRVSGDVVRIEIEVPFALTTFGMLNAFSGGNLGSSLTMSIAEEARHFGE